MKARALPQIEESELTEDFVAQLEDSGQVADALASGLALPGMGSMRGEPVRVDRCVWRTVTLTQTRAQRLRLRDVRVEGSDLANLEVTGGGMERVEFRSTRMTGFNGTEAQLKSVLFEECKLDLAVLRMARLSECRFERCNLSDADFYGTDLTGTVFRGCDLSRADLSHARLGGADLRGCRLDGMRGTPAEMEGLVIAPEQAAMLIPLFGVKVEW